MSPTRRRFIETASLALLASTVFPSAIAQNSLQPKSDPFGPERLTLFNGVSPRTFQSLIGEAFAASSGDQAFGSLTLLSVAVSEPAKPTRPVANVRRVGPAPRPSEQSLSGFSLRFQGNGAALSQGTYTLQNDALGSFPLFIVPAGPGVNPPTYTAIFNFVGPAASS